MREGPTCSGSSTSKRLLAVVMYPTKVAEMHAALLLSLRASKGASLVKMPRWLKSCPLQASINLHKPTSCHLSANSLFACVVYVRVYVCVCLVVGANAHGHSTFTSQTKCKLHITRPYLAFRSSSFCMQFLQHDISTIQQPADTLPTAFYILKMNLSSVTL